MDDEKMIRAVLAGHALQGLLAHYGSFDNAEHQALARADRLLGMMKKDSPAPAPESAPPLADDAPAAGDVPKCEAYTCEERGTEEYAVGRHKEDSAFFCPLHAKVRPANILLEWHRAFVRDRLEKKERAA